MSHKEPDKVTAPLTITSGNEVVSDIESANDIVNCFCGTTNDDGTDMVQCDTCSEWSHCACYKLSEAAAKQIDFECHSCLAVQPLQLPLPHSSSSSTLDSDNILSDPATPRTKANPFDTAIELSDQPIGNPNSLNSDTGSPGFVEPPRTDAPNLQIDPPVISIPQNSAMDSIASNPPCYPPSIDAIESLKTKVLELETTIQKMSDSYKGDLAIMQSQILSLQEGIENIKKSQPTKRRSDTRPSSGTKNMHKPKKHSTPSA